MSYTPQGLVTVAFLKTQLDEGHDHLSLFEPLVLDALRQISSHDLIANEIRDIVFERTNLKIPVPTIQTLLGRFAKNGYLERRGGRFHKTQLPLPPSYVATASEAIRAGQNRLGRALIEHFQRVGITFASPEEAVQGLASFISAHKLELLLHQSPGESKQVSLKNTRNYARFITQRCIPDAELNQPLKSLLEGILLADVLLMRDIQSAEMRFLGCRVYLDTRILLAALGLHGTADEEATKEGLAAIRNAGAQTLAFERTVIEVRGILRVYEDKLGTNEGLLSLFPNSLTSHFISMRYTPADIKVFSLELEQRLRRIAISVEPFPTHVPEYTLDEESLTKNLSRIGGRTYDIEPRAKHDTDCTAAILTLRSGQAAFDLERCEAVFSTTSGMVVKNVQQWYQDQKGEGIPPVVHHAFLTTLAWLKKPTFSPDLKLHELAAICLSAMRPTEAAWEKMLATIRQYVAEGRMSDDESVAIVANGLTETLLSQLDDDFEPDSRSINEAIERVREELRREHIVAAQIEVERVRVEAQTLLDAALDREEAAKNAATLAQKSASDAFATANRALSQMDRLINGIAKVAGVAVRWLIISGLLAGTLLSVVHIAQSSHRAASWLITGLLSICSILSFLGSSWGISAKSMGERLESWIKNRLRNSTT